MSARNYTVTVQLTDGGILQKLDKLQNGSPVNGGGSNGSGGLAAAAEGGRGGIFGKIADLNVMQLAKLGAIALGVNKMAGLMIESSGILQGTLKLWERSMMLVFKPIADFIGLALRPVVMALFSSFILPFYKHVYPFFRDYGTAVGEALANFMKDPMGGITDATANVGAIATLTVGKVQEAIDNFATDLGEKLANVPGMVWGFFVSVGEGIWDKLSQVGSMLWGFFVGIADSIWQSLSQVGGMLWGFFVGIADGIWQTLSQAGSMFWGFFVAIGDSIWSTLSGVPDMIMGTFSSLAKNLTATLADVPQMILDAIMRSIRALTGGRFGTSSGNLPSWVNGQGQATTTAAIADTL